MRRLRPYRFLRGWSAWLATIGAACLPLSAATPLHEFFLRQATEGDRPARHRHSRDALCSHLFICFAAQMVNRSGSQLGGGAVKASSPAPAGPHRRGRTEQMPTTCSNTGRSRCQPIPAPVSYRRQRLSQIFRRQYVRTVPPSRTAAAATRYPDADDLDALARRSCVLGSNQSCACKERIARGVKCLPDRRRPEWLGNVIRVR